MQNTWSSYRVLASLPGICLEVSVVSEIHQVHLIIGMLGYLFYNLTRIVANKPDAVIISLFISAPILVGVS